MTEYSSSVTLEPPKRFAITSADVKSPATIDGERDPELRAAWQELADNSLLEWQRDPSQLDEEGTTTPSIETIQRAIRLASDLDGRGVPAPIRIVPDVQGGIVFEFEWGQLFESLHIQPAGNVEHRRFYRNRLVWRDQWFDRDRT